MPEEKIIDDYYSSIKSTSWENKSWKKDDSQKVKVKKVIKKVVKKTEEPINSSDFSTNNKESNKENKVVKKKIIQKVNVVENTGEEKKVEKEAKFSFKNNKTIKPKNFWEDKPRWWLKNKNFKNKNQEEDNSKKKTFQKTKTRWKFRFYDKEPEDTSFTRSQKIIKTKKEEKKVEDIKQNLTVRTWETITIWETFSLKEFSEKVWVPLVKLIAEFMKNGMMVNINSKIDFDSASIIAEAFEVKLQKDNSSWVSVKELMSWNIADLLVEEDSSKLEERPPVVSIMWHVDHGKTSLLDCIRKSKIADWEAWGITQSIWAYQVEQNGKKITFLDTPGHEAFTIMRYRGAKATDIAVLVVAADEGIKPQTLESISHAKEAWIPVIVAINKMDKQGANPDHVKWQLSENGLTPEDWWGDTPVVPVSAKTWFWIDDLLEILLLVAEIKELKANPNRNWVATVIESHLDKSLWPVSTVLVNTWTINKGDNVVCNDSFWKVKVMKNFENIWLLKSLPWDPVLIIWLDKVVNWWDILQVVSSSSIAKSKADEYRELTKQEEKNKSSWLEVLMSKIKAGNLKQLKVLIKADTNGSLEAIKSSILKLSTDETNIAIIHSWVWNITEWDVLMVNSSEAVLVWFNIDIVSSAKTILERSDVTYINSKIIYHITEKIEKIVSWMLDPREIEIFLWNASVLAKFYTDKKFLILWIDLKKDSKIESNCLARVIRKDKKILDWKITSLKQWIEEVKELEWPLECWIRFEWKTDVEEGDLLEIYKIEIQKNI